MSRAARVNEILRRADVAWVIAMNAIPVFAVVVFGWQALPLLLFYWIENVVVGVLNIFKIVATGVANANVHPLTVAFLTVLFIVHYGVFCLLHGAVVFATFLIGDLIWRDASAGVSPVDLLARAGLTLEIGSELFWGTVVLLVARVGEFLAVWVRGRRWLGVEPGKQMFEPYARLIVLHVTLIIAAIPVIAFGQPMVAVLAMALLKCGLDLGLPQYRILVFDPSAR